MKSKKILILLILAFALLLVVISVEAAKPVISQDVVVWTLTKTELISPGQVIEMDEGVFTQGILVQAKAKSKGGNVVPEGDFILKFDVFVPKHDMDFQKAGMYYVYGEWTITKKGASPESKAARHSPDKIQGTIMTELPFDPLGGSNWTAAASLPMSSAAGRWGHGQGTLTLNALLEGDLFLDLKQWPELQGR